MRSAYIALILLCACGDNRAAMIDAVDVDSAIDAPIDAPMCEAFTAETPGGTCSDGSIGMATACSTEADSFCLGGINGPFEPGPRFPPDGYCFRGSGTCNDDADCGSRGVCVDIDGFKSCMGACCSASTCPDGMLCSGSINGNQVFANDKRACVPGDATAQDGDPCEHMGNCSFDSRCRSTDYDYPGGYCRTQGCTVGDDTTCADGGRCVTSYDPFVPDNFCVKPCIMDSDCREAEGYRCIDGTAQGRGMYCEHPKMGDACVANTDCGTGMANTMTCDTNQADGYCTVSCSTPGAFTGCSDRSLCYDPDAVDNVDGNEYCARRCNTVADCRNGYQCLEVTTGASNKVCVP